MDKVFLLLFFACCFQISYSQKNSDSAVKKDDSSSGIKIAPDTIWIPLSRSEFVMIQNILSQLIQQSDQAILLQNMNAELRRQSKPKKKPKP